MSEGCLVCALLQSFMCLIGAAMMGHTCCGEPCAWSCSRHWLVTAAQAGEHARVKRLSSKLRSGISMLLLWLLPPLAGNFACNQHGGDHPCCGSGACMPSVSVSCMLLQVIANACAEKKAELRVLERNVTALSSTNAALRSWLQAHEPRATALPATVTPDSAIVPVDSLCEQALAARVRSLLCTCIGWMRVCVLLLLLLVPADNLSVGWWGWPDWRW